MSNSLTIEQIEIGTDFKNSDVGTISTVTAKTSNSVELFNRTDRNNRYSSGEKDADGVTQKTGRRRGVDGRNWYTVKDFNFQFTSI